MKINLDNIQNPIVRKALMKRQDHFMFNFLFGEERNKSDHEDWDEHGDYSERYTHTDDTAGRKVSLHTDHTESTYEQHSEYDVYQEHNESIGHCDGPYR